MSSPSEPKAPESAKPVSEEPEQTEAEQAAWALRSAEIHRQNIAAEQANDRLHRWQQGYRDFGSDY